MLTLLSWRMVVTEVVRWRGKVEHELAGLSRAWF